MLLSLSDADSLDLKQRNGRNLNGLSFDSRQSFILRGRSFPFVRRAAWI